jgi:hypothetical protein
LHAVTADQTDYKFDLTIGKEQIKGKKEKRARKSIRGARRQSNHEECRPKLFAGY